MNSSLSTQSALYIHAIKTIARQRGEIKRPKDIVDKLPTQREWQAVVDALAFTSCNSGCVSDAHIRVSKKVETLYKAAEAEGGG